jgi:hypothetical protein
MLLKRNTAICREKQEREMENKKSKLELSPHGNGEYPGTFDADAEREADALSTKVWGLIDCCR